MAPVIYLTVVRDASSDKGDAILIAGALPLFQGADHDESLACGVCKAVIGKDISTRSVYKLFTVERRLIARCLCGGDNLLPAIIAPE